MRFLAITTALCIAGASGCGAPDVGSGDTGTVESELNGGYLYSCRRLHQGHDGKEIAKIHVDKSVATFMSSDSSLSAFDGDYAIQPNYKPHSATHKGQVEYVGYPVKNKSGTNGYRMVLLVDGSLRTGGNPLNIGGHGGFVDLEGPYLPRAADHYLCHR